MMSEYILRADAIKAIQKYGVGCLDADDFSPEQSERFVIHKLNELPSVTPLSEHQKFILSQMVNSDAKTIEEIGLMYQKQLAEIYQQQNR